MAVQAVDKVSETTPVVSNDTTTSPEKKDYTNMTAKEILNAEKAGESIPAEILSWAKENPDSKETYKASQGESAQAKEENDAVAYRTSMEEDGMSLKEICKQFTQMSAQKENRDLQNVSKMAPYTQQVPTDNQNGNNATSEVKNAISEIAKEILSKKTVLRLSLGIKADELKFFDALKQENSNELTTIDDSLESIQDILNGVISDAKESKQYGEETKKIGQEYKSNTKWIRFKQRRIAKQAIEQGDNTVKMSERTDKLAQAIAKDNGVALNNSKNNIQTVEQANIEENNQGEQAPAESKTASATPAQTQPATTSSKPS